MTVQNIERQLKIEEKESPMWMMFVHAQHMTKSDEMQYQNKGIKRKGTAGHTELKSLTKKTKTKEPKLELIYRQATITS